MPKHFEYVFTAYGLWIAVFLVYCTYLFRKSRRISRALDSLSSHQSSKAEKTS